MKKILIAVLMLLLLVLAGTAMINGISFASDDNDPSAGIRILSVKQIMDLNSGLEDAIKNVDVLQRVNYPEEKERLSSSISELLERKEEYFNIAKISTEGEITKANTKETYMIEYLWTRIGRHATSEGVNLKMDVKNSNNAEDSSFRDLAFSVTGEYIGIMEFVSSLEDDDELNFKIENFNMISNGENLTATFNVRDIRIKIERTSSDNPISNSTTNENVTESGTSDEDSNTQTNEENEDTDTSTTTDENDETSTSTTTDENDDTSTSTTTDENDDTDSEENPQS